MLQLCKEAFSTIFFQLVILVLQYNLKWWYLVFGLGEAFVVVLKSYVPMWTAPTQHTIIINFQQVCVTTFSVIPLC